MGVETPSEIDLDLNKYFIFCAFLQKSSKNEINIWSSKEVSTSSSAVDSF